MKKMFSLVLVLAYAFALIGCSAADADQNHNINTMSKVDAMMEISLIYVETELKLTDVSCVLGNPLSVFRLTGGKLVPSAYEKYPVFAEGKVVAFTSCFLSDTGEYLTNCGADYAESFWLEYSKQPDIPVAIVYAQDGAYLVREGDPPVMLHNMPVAGCDSIQELENCRSSLVYSVP